MGFKGQDFKNSTLKNEELRQAKINDLRNRCNEFCKEFNEKLIKEGVDECQDTLIAYFDSLKKEPKKAS